MRLGNMLQAGAEQKADASFAQVIGNNFSDAGHINLHVRGH